MTLFHKLVYVLFLAFLLVAFHAAYQEAAHMIHRMNFGEYEIIYDAADLDPPSRIAI